MKNRIKSRWVAVWLAAGMMWVPFSSGNTAATEEYAAKAAFILNFAKFVSWPVSAFASPTAPLVIGIVGTDPFKDSMEKTVEGRMVETHPLVIKRGTAAELKKCHIVFLVGGNLEGFAGLPVLTVSDTAGFIDRGGMIQFASEQQKIVFLVNKTAALKSQLTISSRLLQLAKTVK